MTIQKAVTGAWNPLVQGILALATVGTVLYLFAAREPVPGELLVFAGAVLGTYFPKPAPVQ